MIHLPLFFVQPEVSLSFPGDGLLINRAVWSEVTVAEF